MKQRAIHIYHKRATLVKTLLLLLLMTGCFGAAAQSVSYLKPVYKTTGDPTSGFAHWVTAQCTAYVTVAEDQTSWGAEGTDTWYVLDSYVYIFNNSVECRGNVHLILTNGSTLTI